LTISRNALRRRPLVAEDHRDFRYSEFARGFETEMTIDHFSVIANQTWNFEPELADATAHAIHGSIVLPWISRVFYESFNQPGLNALHLGLRYHASPSKNENV